MPESTDETITIPDVVVREIGSLHLQLSLARARIVELEEQLTMMSERLVADVTERVT